ncbi:citrate/2-methylcitrate synthase [Amycolatopsis thermoflava]|uniref:citrate/2-methylcitrate synthase n=1 Tax=Amycolatopsis thermoflava TaxID=84480 RepID=UPI003646C30D
MGGIIGGRLVYRGRDAVELAGSAAYAEVAELLWSGLPGPGGFATLDPGIRALLTRMSAVMPEGCLPLDRLKAAAAVLGAADPLRYDLSRPAVVSVARTLAPAFVEALPIPDGCADDPAGDLVARLWVKLAGARPSPAQLALLTGALILLADHGVGPSTRAVREAAARQADPYSAVLAGTSVAAGLLHGGGSSLAVQAWLEEIGSVEAVPRALADRLVRGDRISGFGQPRYPGADPRAVRMMQLLDDSGGRPERLRIVHQVIDLVRSRRNLDPNAEFALGAMCFVHGMPRGAGEAVFVIARSAGWIAHAIEEYDRDGGAGGTLPRG